MTWHEITAAEYFALAKGAPLGETLSDPMGQFGAPRMLTTWLTPDGEPLARHQCWPIGHTTGFARPCLFEEWRGSSEGGPHA